MKIELKKISFNERMSEETNCFIADLYINGKKVGYCKNDGHGGCTDYRGDSKANNELIEKAEVYCMALPHNEFGEQSLEDVVDEFLENYLKIKIDLKNRKKLEKEMLTGILWGVRNSGRYTVLKYAVPLTHVAKVQLQKLQKTIDEIKELYCVDDIVILNTNLKELGITV